MFQQNDSVSKSHQSLCTHVTLVLERRICETETFCPVVGHQMAQDTAIKTIAFESFSIFGGYLLHGLDGVDSVICEQPL